MTRDRAYVNLHPVVHVLQECLLEYYNANVLYIKEYIESVMIHDVQQSFSKCILAVTYYYVARIMEQY